MENQKVNNALYTARQKMSEAQILEAQKALVEALPLCVLADAVYAFLEVIKKNVGWPGSIGVRWVQGYITNWKKENCS